MQDATDFRGFSYENEDLMDREPEITGSATYDDNMNFEQINDDTASNENNFDKSPVLTNKDSVVSMEFQT